MDPISELQATQSGVITRGQVLARGGTPSDIARHLRRREWVRLLPGVFLDHTGEVTWLQRAWAGVLFHEPAALAGRSAIRVVVGPGWRRHDDGDPIEIAVPQDRHVRPRPGFVIVRPSGFAERVQWNATPPRLRLEQAGLDIALGAPSEFALVGLMADLCQTRRTTARRLLDALDGRPRVPQRAFLRGVLDDIAAGTCSVLERGHLERVERAHGLPRGARQVPTGAPRPGFRDVDYGGLVVELDGRLFHDSAEQRDRDLDRDLAAAVTGELTVRLGWGQVFDRPCVTAAHLGVMLQAVGWTGVPRPCGPECGVASSTPPEDCRAAVCNALLTGPTLPNVTSMQEFRGRAAIAPLCHAASDCWGDRSTLHPGNVWWSALPRHGTVDDWRVAIWADSAGPVAAAWLDGPHHGTILAAPAHPKREKLLSDAAHWAVKHGDQHELRTEVLETDRAVVAAWEKAGLRPRVSPAYLLRDVRDLANLGDPAALPGYRTRPVRDTAVDQDARVELHVASWSTTIHLSDFDVAGYTILRQSPYYRPQLDIVVEGPDGRLHGSVLIWFDELTRVGLLWPVGVRPESRRMGLGRAVVLSALWALRALGGHEVIVWPRGDNDYPGPARLFTSLGWTNSGRTIPLAC